MEKNVKSAESVTCKDRAKSSIPTSLWSFIRYKITPSPIIPSIYFVLSTCTFHSSPCDVPYNYFKHCKKWIIMKQMKKNGEEILWLLYPEKEVVTTIIWAHSVHSMTLLSTFHFHFYSLVSTHWNFVFCLSFFLFSCLCYPQYVAYTQYGLQHIGTLWCSITLWECVKNETSSTSIGIFTAVLLLLKNNIEKSGLAYERDFIKVSYGLRRLSAYEWILCKHIVMCTYINTNFFFLVFLSCSYHIVNGHKLNITTDPD